MTEMPLRRRTVLRGVAAGTLGGVAMQPAAARRGHGRYVVGTKTKAGKRAAASRAKEVIHDLDLGETGGVVAGKFPEEALNGLRHRPDVRYIEQDIRAFALGEALPDGIDRVDADVAHNNGQTGAGADIAIIDTGIDSDHPDLEANLGDGYAVTSCSSNCTASWDDDNNHGTHCAGIADADDNTEGVVGVSTEATLHAVKVLDSSGSGYFSDVVDGIRWVADQGYDVASISLGASSGTQSLRDACQYADDKGVLLVAAAGNYGPCSDCVLYPAAYDTVMAVSAVDDSDNLAYVSSTGPEVDLAAPGVGIRSTIPEGSYGNRSGTSMACPHVSGAAGQLMANGLSNTEARRRLTSTAEDIGLGSNQQGEGLLDVEAALGTSSDTNVAVSTGKVASIGETTATITGSLDDLGGASSVDFAFEYRPTGASSTSTTSTQTLSASGSFSADISGLASGTDYEFRAVATASDGDTDAGSYVTFTTGTADTSVAVTTDGTASVGETTATIEGTLTDLGGASDADVAFEWGPAGNGLPNKTTVQTLSNTGGFSASLDGLASGTDYEFRAVATASDGDTDTGESVTFTSDSASTGDTVPVVDSYRVTEAGSPNPHAEITANWAISDADGDLDGVKIDVLDSKGRVVDSTQSNASGSNASDSAHFKIKHARGATYDVTLTVTDTRSNTAIVTQTVSE